MARILIVDDEPSILTTFQLLLESVGYQVTTAPSAAQATQKLRDENFDVVITDIRMETSTAGFDVVRATRERLPTASIAVLTAFPVPTSEWKNAGAHALFMKGTEVKTMLNWIRGRLEASIAPPKKPR